MVENWADVVADRIVDAGFLRQGKPGSPQAPHRAGGALLMLGAADTGKTTLMDALAQCVEQARQAAPVVLIDTSGLVTGGAACSLWWAVQRLLRPERIIAIQRENELAELLGGLQVGLSAIERIEAPPELHRKSPEARQEHRRRLFAEYFQDATIYTLNLKDLAVRSTQRMTPDNLLGRIACLTDAAGQDLALGVIERWLPRTARMTLRVPPLDIRRVRCLSVGNARIEPDVGWSG